MTLLPDTARQVDMADPLVPVLHRVVASWQEAADVTTLVLAPLTGPPPPFRPGQFNMVTALGVGEAALSLSGPCGSEHPLCHTVRDVGPVTHALCGAQAGELVGVRGPFGTDWGVDGLDGDVVVVAGGIGLAPLRGAIEDLVTTGGPVGAAAHRRVFVLVGAREPAQVIFGDDLRRWARAGARVDVTVDGAGPSWHGHVGLVTSLLDDVGFDPARTTALVCGPEVMIRFTARALTDHGVDPLRIRVALERNMQCGVAWCGHCQLGPILLCRDGPILPYDEGLARLLTEPER